jgi:phosphopantothenoylcysteine synthetase/decarboxylase
VDLVVVNRVGRAGTGFGSDTNDALLLSADDDDVPLGSWTKAELARTLMDRVAGLLAERPPRVGPGS